MNNCEKVLNEILHSRTGVDFQMNPELMDENLFGSKINLPPRELVLILHDIENSFNIRISNNILLKGEFNSYSNIKKIVCG